MSDAEPHLKIDSHVVIQLGAELISDSEQALLELVKNAYDGDATRCTIVIEPDWLPEQDTESWKHFQAQLEHGARIGRIVVEDNGTGLDDRAVTGGWLLISASLKRSATGDKLRTARQRIPVGDKGLGRLATMRLGDLLLLRTKTARERQARTVSFAWSDFKAGAVLENIKVHLGTSPTLRTRDHGTDVEIHGLLEPPYWESEKNIQGVVAKLSSLISPFQPIQDFKVFIRAGEQLRDLQLLGADALNHASAKFTFQYTNGVLEAKAWFSRTLFRGKSGQQAGRVYEQLLADDKLPAVIASLQSAPRLKGHGFVPLTGTPGGWLFSLQQSISLADMPSNPKITGWKDPGPFTAELYYVLFNEPTKNALEAAGIPIEMLQEMTSVGVFRDGFRIRMTDDWLEISKGVTSGGFFQLRPRNVIGYFAISNKHNSALVEKSDREGFVDNEYSRGFLFLADRAKKFANDALEAVRTVYDDYKKTQLGARNVTSPDDDPDSGNVELLEHGAAAKQAIQLAKGRSVAIATKVEAVRISLSELASPAAESLSRHVASDLGAITDSLIEFQEILAGAEDDADASIVAAEGLLQTNEELGERNLRLIDAAAVGLSARALTHEINAYITLIDTALTKVRRVHKGKPDKRLQDAIDAIAGAVRELRKSVSTINPLLAGSRTLKDNFQIGDAIREFVQLRAARLADAKIELTVVGGTGSRIRFGRTRFNQILENLLQNSLYWINEHGTSDNKVKCSILVEIDRSGFTWSDGAKGVRPALEETLFEPYVTDKPASSGQGLGLFLITAFLQAEKCDIVLLSERNVFGRRYKFRVDLAGAMQ
jgi:signal transduction histidine kinase